MGCNGGLVCFYFLKKRTYKHLYIKINDRYKERFTFQAFATEKEKVLGNVQ